MDEKSHKNILVYDNSYKTLIGVKPLRFRFDKADGFIRVYDGTKYLVLFEGEKYDFIYNRIRYLIGVKCAHNHAKIKVDSYDSLPLEKTFIIHIKSVWNKDQNHNYNNIFLGASHISVFVRNAQCIIMTQTR